MHALASELLPVRQRPRSYQQHVALNSECPSPSSPSAAPAGKGNSSSSSTFSPASHSTAAAAAAGKRGEDEMEPLLQVQQQHGVAPGAPASTNSSRHHGHASKGTWVTAVFHIVTAVVGAGVLGLPNAMAWLGLPTGCLLLLAFYLSTLWTSRVLAEAKDRAGPQATTYRELVHELLGPRHCLALTCCQYVQLVLVTIGYTVTGGASLRNMVRQLCDGDVECEPQVWEREVWAAGEHDRLQQSVLLFGAFQLLLSQMPSLESAWWSSLVGAATSLLYSLIALGLGLAHADSKRLSAGGRAAAPVDKVFGLFGAVGTMAFAFSFAAVLVEIQATLSSPPSTAVTMKRAISVSVSTSALLYMCVAVAGYAALGDVVPGDILQGFSHPRSLVSIASCAVLVHMAMAYQVFAQPVFALLESTLASHTCWPGSMPKSALAFTAVDAESAWSPAASTSASASASLPATAAKAGGAGVRQSAAALGLSGLTAAGTLPLLLATSSRQKQWPASELEMEQLESRAPLLGGAAVAMVGRQETHGKREDAGGSRSGGSAAEGRRGTGEEDGGIRERGGGALCGRSPAGAEAAVSGPGPGLHRGAKTAAGGQGVLPVYVRVGLRSLYVLLISLLAAAVPYFHLVISLIGALTFWLPSIHLPVVLYTTTSPHPVSPRRRAFAYTLDAAFLCATAMAFVASARTMWLQLLHPSEESQH